MTTFPILRSRRLRRTPQIRALVRETHLSAGDLIYPLFVSSGESRATALPQLPGASLLAGTAVADEAGRIEALGIPAVLLFGVVDAQHKDAAGSLVTSPDGPVQQAVRRIGSSAPSLTIIADLCLCEYTSHGHCGLPDGDEIDNDRTLEVLRAAAVSLATAGCDVIAPSGVMDGTVQALRSALDAAGFGNVLTMPYSAKFASVLYGPFKMATASTPGESRHATHQLDPANARQALARMATDEAEGADIMIVKPAGSSLDVLARARERFDTPLAAYQVSGEYNMALALAAGDEESRRRIALELLTTIRRAGADMIITYFAPDAARWLRAG